jgi:hypothetical protein
LAALQALQAGLRAEETPESSLFLFVRSLALRYGPHMKTAPWSLILALACSACVGPSATGLSHRQDYLVVVKSVRLPESMAWYVQFAEHTWVDVKDGDESSWTRLEVVSRSSGVGIVPISPEQARDSERWSRSVAVLETLVGKRAKEAIPQLLKVATEQEDFGRREHLDVGEGEHSFVVHPPEARSYEAWPGPNSNTFVVDLLQGVPGLNGELHHNAVGKDYPRGVRVGATSAGFGLEIDTAYLGLGLGLRQGFELRLAQLTFGLSLWPPAIKLPFLPRLGIHQGWVGAAPGSFDE